MVGPLCEATKKCTLISPRRYRAHFSRSFECAINLKWEHWETTLQDCEACLSLPIGTIVSECFAQIKSTLEQVISFFTSCIPFRSVQWLSVFFAPQQLEPGKETGFCISLCYSPFTRSTNARATCPAKSQGLPRKGTSRTIHHCLRILDAGCESISR